MSSPKGPGRKMNPGPNINQSAQLPVPDEAVEGLIREILDGKDLERFESLPYKVKSEILGHFKDALTKVTVKRFRPNILGAEPDDMAGVFVNFSLDPKDWTNPTYYKKWALGLLQGVLKLSDFSIVQEQKLIGAAISGEKYNGRNIFEEVFGKEPLVERQPFEYYEFDPTRIDLSNLEDSVKRSGTDYIYRPKTRVLISKQGRKGVTYSSIANLDPYKNFASSVTDFIPKSQNFQVRDPALKAVEESFINVVEGEIGTHGFTKSIKGIPTELGYVLSNPRSPLVARDFLGVPKFVEARLKKERIVKNRKAPLRLQDFISKGDLETAYGLKLKLKTLKTATGGVASLRSFLLYNDNWKKLGFSSKKAVEQLTSHRVRSLRDLAEVRDSLFTATYRGPLSRGFVGFTPGKVVPELFSPEVKKQDLMLFRDIVQNLEEKVSQTLDALIEHQASILGLNFDRVLDLVVSNVPEKLREEVKKDLKNAYGYFEFVENRANQIMLSEFIDAIESGNVWQVYFYYQKYNKYVDKLLGKVLPFYNTFVNIRIGKYKVGDIFTIESSIRDRISTAIGLTSSGYVAKKAPLLVKLLPFLTLNHVYLHTKDFIRIDNIKASNVFLGLNSSNERFTFFPGKTFKNLKDVQERFKSSGLFKSLRRGSLNVFAKDFKGAPYVLAVFEKLLNYDKSLISGEAGVHAVFATLYHIYKSGNIRDFRDTVNIFFGDVLSPSEQKTFIKVFLPLLKNLQKYENRGLDPLDMFSFLAFHVKGKFIKGDAIKKYVGIINGISIKVNYLQTWVFDWIEKKVLYHTLFKLPFFGKNVAKPLWNLYNPGIGPIARAKIILFSISKKFPGLVKIVSKLASPFSKIFSLVGISISSAATLGLAYLAYALQRYTTALIKGFWDFIRGRGLKTLIAELSKATNSVFVTIPKFFAKFVIYTSIVIVTLTTLLYYYFSYILFDQSDRPVANTYSEEYLGDSLGLVKTPNGQFCSPINPNKPPAGPLKGLLSFFPYYFNTYAVTDCPGLPGSYEVHKGVDIAIPKGVGVPNPFKGDAEVVFSGYSTAGYGNLVILKIIVDNNPYFLYFAHMSSRLVGVGDIVSSQQLIGRVGSPGNSTGPHLHFEVRAGSRSIKNVLNPCSVISCNSLSGNGASCSTKDWIDFACSN